MAKSDESFMRWRPHPWHGLSPGSDPPRRILAYIEITPFDLVKYEIDPRTGYLKVDRPQRSSSLPPALYGLIPQTLCGPKVGKLTHNAHGGDGDPLDVCVVCESPIRRAEVVLEANVVGGFQTIDGGKADDKIIAVFFNDMYWRDVQDISGLPPSLIERLRHYFATYKLVPGKPPTVTVEGTYGREHALKVVEASMADYRDRFAGAHEKTCPHCQMPLGSAVEL